MPASDGKLRRIQAATTEGLFRIIQSIPSKKAEPFKMWLAKVGKERLDEMADPEKHLIEDYLTIEKRDILTSGLNNDYNLKIYVMN